MGGKKHPAVQTAQTAPGALSTGSRIGQVGNPTSSMGLGLLSMLMGGITMYDAAADAQENGWNAGNGFDLARGGSGVLSGYAGASGMAGEAIAAGSVEAAFGTSLLGSIGAILGAGAAGYGVGSLAERTASSDYAHTPMAGLDPWGRPRSQVDASIDFGVDVNDWIDEATGTDMLGDVVGGALAVGGAVKNTPGAMWDATTGFVGEQASNAWNALFD